MKLLESILLTTVITMLAAANTLSQGTCYPPLPPQNVSLPPPPCYGSDTYVHMLSYVIYWGDLISQQDLSGVVNGSCSYGWDCVPITREPDLLLKDCPPRLSYEPGIIQERPDIGGPGGVLGYTFYSNFASTSVNYTCGQCEHGVLGANYAQKVTCDEIEVDSDTIYGPCLRF
jgi:hypothetical protein